MKIHQQISTIVFVFLSQTLAAEPMLLLKSGPVRMSELKTNLAAIDSTAVATQKRNVYSRAMSPNEGSKSTSRDTVANSPVYWILQFQSTIGASDQSELKANNVEVLGYLPENAYIVRATNEQLLNLKKNNSNVHDYVIYHSELKLSPELRVRSVLNRHQIKTVRLHLFEGVHAQTLVMQLMYDGHVVVDSSDSVIVVRAPVEKINDLASLTGVERLSEMPRMQLRHFVIPHALDGGGASQPGLLSDLTGYESGTQVLRFQEAWSQGLRGEGQIVGVADTGLDTGDKQTLFSDFANYHSAYVLGYGSRTWADFQGHGTHVMGSVGGVGAGSKGIVTGGAVASKLVAQSLWSTTHNTLTTPGDLKVIFQQAYRAGVRVHSNSWGDPNARGVYNEESSQVDHFVWNNPDMVVLFAAGNDGIDSDSDGRIDAGSVSSPATSKNILSVGASENLVRRGGVQVKLGEITFDSGKPWPAEPIASDTLSNNINGLVAFSSRGPTTDGRIKPDVVAPGSNILSNCSHAEGAEELWGRFDANYCYSGGTSMSTPLAAGGAAIVRQKLITVDRVEPSAALVKAVILHTAFDMYPGQYGEVGEARGQEILSRGPNSDQGYGRLDVREAVDTDYVYIDEKAGVGVGEERVYDSSKRFQKVTLVYTDAPASPDAQVALVNNLDLEVHLNGRVIAASSSRLNNTEQVVLDRPISNARIVVKGVSVPLGRNGKQPFALVYGE